MNRQSHIKERGKGLISLKILMVISVLLLIAALLFMKTEKTEMKTYEIKTENLGSDSEVKYLILSHNNLEDAALIITGEEASYPDKKNLDIEIRKDRIEKASFREVDVSEDFTLFLDTNMDALSIEEYDTAKAYAIDPTQIDFENATFVINATGKQLFKCIEWNFTEQKCYGKWIKIMDLVPGEDYELIITKQDPAFIETNKSYFDLGTYNRTFYNASLKAVVLNVTFNNGSYLSKVFNAEGLTNWTNISWTEGAPYGEELPNNRQIETVPGGANMTGNVLLLHLNDGSGATTFLDTSGNNKNGSCSGANCSTWTTNGKFKGAYSFDGNDRIGTQITTQFTDFSVEVWFKDDGVITQYERLADKNYVNCFWLGRESNVANSWGGGVRENPGPTGKYGIFVTLQDGQWHQIVSVRSGTTHYIYGDGGKVIASNTVSSTACDSTTLAIGAWGDSASTQQRLTGTIDEVSFYNRSLSAQEIADHYRRGAARLNLSVRSCDDENCSGENWNATYENSSQSSQAINVANSQFFQYKADFFTYDSTVAPALYNVTVGYEILDNIPPKIILIYPENNSINTTDKTPEFIFSAVDETASSMSCKLWMNATATGISQIKATNSSVINGSSSVLNPTISLSNGLYLWWINCSDGFNANISEKRIINISVGDIDAPTIQIISPENNSINTTDNSPDFRFIPRDDIADILSCTLWLNETISGVARQYGTNLSVSNGTTAAITANASLSNKNYTWWINCSDGANSNTSVKRIIQIYVDVYSPAVSLSFPAQNQNTVDFSSVNFTCISTDDIYLRNISLYSDYNGAWNFIESKNITGKSASSSFIKNILPDNQFINKHVSWNCLAYDNTSKSNWSYANYTFSNWDLGSHSNTEYNATLNAITLDDYSSDGAYTSDVFDAGFVVGWDNISWGSSAVNIDSEIDYFNNSETKGYYLENDYSVRHWYNVSGIVEDFSQLAVQAALDCDGACSGTVNIRIGNSTSWSDYVFISADAIRTDGTTSDYTYYNNTYNLSMSELGEYFFVQLLVYTGSGTVKFLMDECCGVGNTEGPDPEYRADETGNGDGSQTGWNDDNGDYAIKIKLIKNNNLNISVRSCNDPNCYGESWSEELANSTFSRLSVPDNRYFQYQANMEHVGTTQTPKLYNVTIKYGPADQENPSVAIVSPNHGSGNNGENIVFKYIVNDESLIEKCKIILNNEELGSDYSVAKNTTQEFSFAYLPSGNYNWNINCTDINGNENSSETRTITIVPSYNYGGETTNLSNINIENISNFVIEKPSIGKISFLENINLSGGGNINSYVAISHNLISIDSNNLPQLNKQAELTLYNLTFAKPIVLKDSTYCSDCTILSYTGNLTFSVEGFSSYSASENSQLRIWDDTDEARTYKNSRIGIYANYSSIISGDIITGAGVSCSIIFSDIGTRTMEYNLTYELYLYNRSFSSEGVFAYEITCNDTNDVYASLAAEDYISINARTGPSGANATVIKTERTNITVPPAELEAQRGNITQILFNTTTITRSWQGYYGKVSGRIYLQTVSGYSMYEWNLINITGEVYATRALDVNFVDINCSTITEIANEESYLGQESTDGESVRNTFSTKSHPEFSIGNVTIPENTCNSANLYVNSQAQSEFFYEVLLSDGASNIVYTALIDRNKTGFDSESYDFEMLVGENGDDDVSAVYYFFVEIY